jgi:hypothetical protein
VAETLKIQLQVCGASMKIAIVLELKRNMKYPIVSDFI